MAEASSAKPVVILNAPQMPENIGAVARVMANFGLDALRPVNPRHGWPQERAWASASGADWPLDNARVFATVEEAIADLHRVYATTARPRELQLPILTPRVAADQLAGADDVMIKPVAPGRMMDRVAHITNNRVPFIATNDYLGPERRRASDARPPQIRQLHVVNTLKATIEGNRLSMAELSRAVEGNMKEVMSARLDSHGLKLDWVCSHILKAYAEKRIDKELKERLLILVSVLEDAGRTAVGLGEWDLSQICTQMARQVEEMAESYEDPTSLQFGTIQKLTKAFELAKTAKAGSAAVAAL